MLSKLFLVTNCGRRSLKSEKYSVWSSERSLDSDDGDNGVFGSMPAEEIRVHHQRDHQVHQGDYH